MSIVNRAYQPDILAGARRQSPAADAGLVLLNLLFMPAARERSAAQFAPQSALVGAPELSPRANGLLLFLLTAAGALLRLLHLGSKGLWLDEPATVALARLPWPNFVHIWWYGEASYQGVYFLLMRGWLHLGHSEGWIRLPSALFAIASIPMIYLVARKLVDERVALASAALLAFSPTHVYYSQEARSYTMALLLVLIAAWFFVDAVQQNRERDWLLWTIFGALAFYTHFFAALAILAQGCSVFVVKKPQLWRRMVSHGFVVLAFAAPGLTFLFRVPPHTTDFPWMPRASPKEILHLALFLGGSGEKLILSGILWIAAILAIWRERKQPEKFWPGCFLISWVALPIALNAIMSLHNPVFVQRYLIFCLPATIMLAGRGMIALPRRHLGLWLVLALCVASIVNIFVGYRKPREDWRNASAVVLASAQPGDAVVIYPNFARPGFDYYYGMRATGAPDVHIFARFYDRGDDDRDLSRTLIANPHAMRHVWVMLRDDMAGRNSPADYAPDVAARLQTIYGAPRAQRFQGITVLEFGQAAGQH